MMRLAEAAAAWFPELLAPIKEAARWRSPELSLSEGAALYASMDHVSDEVLAALLFPADREREQRDQALSLAIKAYRELLDRFRERMAEGRWIARGIVAGRPLDGEVTIPPAAWRAGAMPVFGFEEELLRRFLPPPRCV